MSELQSLPMCDHVGCDHPYRLEYCETEAKDIDGDGTLAIEMIEHLLYEAGKSSSGPEYQSDGSMRYIERTVSFLHGDRESWVWPLLETQITLVHQQNVKQKNNAYLVRVGWVAHQQNATTEQYQTFYSLDQWPHAIIGTIEEYDIATERLVDHRAPEHAARPMTPYDLSVLFSHLVEAENALIAADRENSLSVQ